MQVRWWYLSLVVGISLSKGKGKISWTDIVTEKGFSGGCGCEESDYTALEQI